MFSYNRAHILFLFLISILSDSNCFSACHSFTLEERIFVRTLSKKKFEKVEFSRLVRDNANLDKFYHGLVRHFFTQYLASCVLSSGKIQRITDSTLDTTAIGCDLIGRTVSLPGVSFGTDCMSFALRVKADQKAGRHHRRVSEGILDPTESLDIIQEFSRQISRIFLPIVTKLKPAQVKDFSTQLGDKMLKLLKTGLYGGGDNAEIAESMIVALLRPTKKKFKFKNLFSRISLHRLLYETPIKIHGDEKLFFMKIAAKKRSKVDPDMYKLLPPKIEKKLSSEIWKPDALQVVHIRGLGDFFGFENEFFFQGTSSI